MDILLAFSMLQIWLIQSLLECSSCKVGEKWPRNFVNWQAELKTRFNRKYDYQRAKNEDPVALEAWLRMVQATKDQYRVLDDDTYNFDETGFMLGVIGSELVVTGKER